MLPPVDPFLFLEHFDTDIPLENGVETGPEAAVAVVHRPLRGLEAVTILLRGVLAHSDDSFPNEVEVLEPGDAVWVTAGSGVFVSEEPLIPSDERTPDAAGLRLWVNLPRAQKFSLPRFQEVPRETVEEIDLPVAQGAARVQVFAGHVNNATGPAASLGAHVTLALVDLGPNSAARFPVPSQAAGIVYVVDGDVHVGGAAPAQYVREGPQNVGSSRSDSDADRHRADGRTEASVRGTAGARGTVFLLEWPQLRFDAGTVDPSQVRDPVHEFHGGSHGALDHHLDDFDPATSSGDGHWSERLRTPEDEAAIRAQAHREAERTVSRTRVTSVARVPVAMHDDLWLRSGELGATLLVAVGEPLDEALVFRGGFAGSSHADLEQAMRDIAEHRFVDPHDRPVRSGPGHHLRRLGGQREPVGPDVHPQEHHPLHDTHRRHRALHPHGHVAHGGPVHPQGGRAAPHSVLEDDARRARELRQTHNELHPGRLHSFHDDPRVGGRPGAFAGATPPPVPDEGFPVPDGHHLRDDL